MFDILLTMIDYRLIKFH